MIDDLIKLINALMPFALAVVAWQVNSTRKEVKGSQKETRENIGHLAKSINGGQHEMVANAVNIAMREGARLGAASNNSPEGNQRVEDRLAQVSQQAVEATQAAKVISSEAVEAILEVPKK